MTHYHWRQSRCTDYKCPGGHDCLISFGPISGFIEIATSLLAHLGYDPAEHQALVTELEAVIGDEVLQIGYDTLAENGMPVRCGVSREVLVPVNTQTS